MIILTILIVLIKPIKSPIQKAGGEILQAKS